jgi:hypothetical protein
MPAVHVNDALLFLGVLARAFAPLVHAAERRRPLRALRWDRPAAETLATCSGRGEPAAATAELLDVVTDQVDAFIAAAARRDGRYVLATAWFDDAHVTRFLGANQHAGTWWFHRESFDALLRWLVVMTEVELGATRSLSVEARASRLASCQDLAAELSRAAAAAGYRVEGLSARVRG